MKKLTFKSIDSEKNSMCVDLIQSIEASKKRRHSSRKGVINGHWWLKPTILAAWEAETGRVMI
jgi:hypothetical protein